MKRPAFRCFQIVASIEDGAAGPSYSVARLSAELERHGVPTTVFTVQGWRKSADRPSGNERAVAGHIAYAQDLARLPVLNRLCVSHALFDALLRCPSGNDILHAHGLWLMPNVYPAWAAKRNGAILLISPRGMLGKEALRFSGWQKRIFWRLLQGTAAASARCLHATSEQEYQDIREFGLKNPVAVIPNGIDLPELAQAARPAAGGRTVLSLGRIHPKKGLDRLIRAWATIEPRFPEWRLSVVGPDEIGYARQLKDLARLHRLSRVTFESALYGSAKLAALRDADVFVLSSRNENFGMVVAEALAAATPVIATTGAPWSELPRRGCGWWVDSSDAALAAALSAAMQMPQSALREMGARGRNWMAENFAWPRVAADMRRVYQWLTAGGETPETVRLG